MHGALKSGLKTSAKCVIKIFPVPAEDILKAPESYHLYFQKREPVLNPLYEKSAWRGRFWSQHHRQHSLFNKKLLFFNCCTNVVPHEASARCFLYRFSSGGCQQRACSHLFLTIYDKFFQVSFLFLLPHQKAGRQQHQGENDRA